MKDSNTLTEVLPPERMTTEGAPRGYGVELMQTAIERGTENLESIQKFVVTMQATQAEAAYNAAVVQFQAECRIVEKGDTANGRAYARMDRIWAAVRPLMDKCGLAVTWESVKTSGDVVTLDGHLRHRLGHSTALHHEIPLPDRINGQNAAQRAGSGETYAKRYATCAALGIQTGTDDDGNGGIPLDSVDAAQLETLREWCRETNTSEDTLAQSAGVKSLADFPAKKYDWAIGIFQRKAAKR